MDVGVELGGWQAYPGTGTGFAVFLPLLFRPFYQTVVYECTNKYYKYVPC